MRLGVSSELFEIQPALLSYGYGLFTRVSQIAHPTKHCRTCSRPVWVKEKPIKSNKRTAWSIRKGKPWLDHCLGSRRSFVDCPLHPSTCHGYPFANGFRHNLNITFPFPSPSDPGDIDQTTTCTTYEYNDRRLGILFLYPPQSPISNKF